MVYYNEACDECAIYINGELQEILQANQVEMVRKDYINQRRTERNWNQKRFLRAVGTAKPPGHIY